MTATGTGAGGAPEAAGVDPAVAALARFADLAVDVLGEAREAVDALNVFPVPDADTGTNMFLTLEAARDTLREWLRDPPGERPGEPPGERPGGDTASVRGACASYSRAALLGARGNSGVILSQLLGQVLRRVAAAGPGESPAVVAADGLRLAVERAYDAVGEPVEGTILTVARAAAEAAAGGGESEESDLATVLRRCVVAAWAALERTPEQLPRLREAGVVDAGGHGLCLVLEAAERALTGRRASGPTPAPRRVPVDGPPVPATAPEPPPSSGAVGPAYEVMYLLEADRQRVRELRATLAGLGDSLVVVGDQDEPATAGLWHVHVHVDDAGAAVEAGLAAGTPRRIRITHLDDHRPAGARRDGRRVLAVSAGPGLATLFAEAGAVVVEGGPGRRPATAALLEAVAGCGAAEVVVLPNDAQTHALAEAVARQGEDLGVKVVVVPTGAQVQGIAALAVHDPTRPLASDVVAMTSAARHTRHGAVTVAAQRAMTSAGPCDAGDVLGAIESDFVMVGTALDSVAQRLLTRLLDNGGELVTLVPGVDAGGLAEQVGAWVESAYPGVDVCVHEGGQSRYPLLFGVE